MVALFAFAPFVVAAVLIAIVFCAYRTGFKDGEEYGQQRAEMEIPLNLKKQKSY